MSHYNQGGDMSEGEYQEMSGLCDAAGEEESRGPPYSHHLDVPAGVWKAKDGRILIKDMTDLHLHNAIRRLCASGFGDHLKCVELLSEWRDRILRGPTAVAKPPKAKMPPPPCAHCGAVFERAMRDGKRGWFRQHEADCSAYADCSGADVDRWIAPTLTMPEEASEGETP